MGGRVECLGYNATTNPLEPPINAINADNTWCLLSALIRVYQRPTLFGVCQLVLSTKYAQILPLFRRF